MNVEPADVEDIFIEMMDQFQSWAMAISYTANRLGIKMKEVEETLEDLGYSQEVYE